MLGSIIANSYISKLNNYHLLKYNQKYTLTGVILYPPEIKNNKQQLIITDLLDENNNKYDGNLLVSTSPFPLYQYNQYIQVTTNITKPENFTEDFSYTGYLSLRQIFYIGNFPQVTVPNSTNPHPSTSFLSQFFQKIYALKNNLLQQINRILPYPHSGLLSGLLLGVKNALPTNLYNAFRTVGLTHIIVVSGFNLTIFATLFLTHFRGYIPRIYLLFLTIFCITVFTILTGAESSIVRALFMTIIMISAPFFGRKSNSAISILLAACIMIILNPFILWYDAGFHLSFLATIGIVYFSPIVSPIVSKIPLPEIITGTLGESLSAMIPTTPYIMYSFHQISLVAIISNIIVLPFIPIIMLLGFITLVLSYLHTALALLPNLITTFLLTFIIKTTEFFSEIPYASTQITISTKRMTIIYLVLIIFVFVHQYFPNKNIPT
jgi:competence protein ComEC